MKPLLFVKLGQVGDDCGETGMTSALYGELGFQIGVYSRISEKKNLTEWLKA